MGAAPASCQLSLTLQPGTGSARPRGGLFCPRVAALSAQAFQDEPGPRSRAKKKLNNKHWSFHFLCASKARNAGRNSGLVTQAASVRHLSQEAVAAGHHDREAAALCAPDDAQAAAANGAASPDPRPRRHSKSWLPARGTETMRNLLTQKHMSHFSLAVKRTHLVLNFLYTSTGVSSFLRECAPRAYA